MNFLAHFALAGKDEGLLVGNFVADFINGDDHLDLSISIQKGVEMHRSIDVYTDKHLVFRQGKRKLKRYRHYSGVILDIFYDHFLAVNWHRLFDVPIDAFVKNTYEILERNRKNIPTSSHKALDAMIKYDWLYHYQFIDGIEQVLNSMKKRTSYVSLLDESVFELVKHYKEFNNEFLVFWKDMMDETEGYRKESKE